jgi:hypothetical protein
MKNTTPCMSRWRIRALLCCASGVLLAGCGAGSQGGLSNGPQMAPVEVARTEPAAPPAVEPVPNDPPAEAATPAVAGIPAAPALPAQAVEPAPAASPAAPAAKGDAFALSGYGGSQSSGSTGADAGAAAGGDSNAPAPQTVAPANDAAAGGSGAASRDAAMCKYGACSFH